MKKPKLPTATAEEFDAWCWVLAKQQGGVWKLVDLAKHCFAQWQSARRFKQDKTRMNVELRAKNQRITDRNRGLRDERSSLKRQLSNEAFLRSQGEAWREQMWNANAENEELRQSLCDSQEEISRLRLLSDKQLHLARLQHARILELEQHLATHLVPVPGDPGLAIISYPN